jgi:hypothetical protein
MVTSPAAIPPRHIVAFLRFVSKSRDFRKLGLRRGGFRAGFVTLDIG